jgi:hypothetical protein
LDLILLPPSFYCLSSLYLMFWDLELDPKQ